MKKDMRSYVRCFAVAAAAMIAVYALAVLLARGHVLFPPTLVTGATMLVTEGFLDDGSGLSGSVLHLIAFMIINGYLFIRVWRRKALTPLRASLPSVILTSAVLALSVRYWFWPIAHSERNGTLGGLTAGLEMQGPVFIWTYGVMNLAAFMAASLVLARLTRKGARPCAWLVYNWAIYSALFVILFPWLGGLP